MKRAATILILLLVISGCKAHPASNTRVSPAPEVAKQNTSDSLNNFIQIELKPGINMKLAHISPGEFLMGGNYSTAPESENPMHKVRISKDFYMSITEITQQQWQAVMGNNPSWFKGENLPVTNISWEEASEFCRRISKLTKDRVFRLPTEAEWEYSCRAGTKTIYYWGDQLDISKGNFNSSKPVEVASFAPNPWGLYDMSGNVWEWCLDWYSEKYYESAPDVDPSGPADGKKKVIRGGCFHFKNFQQSGHRYSFDPASSYANLGFRCVMENKR